MLENKIQDSFKLCFTGIKKPHTGTLPTLTMNISFTIV